MEFRIRNISNSYMSRIEKTVIINYIYSALYHVLLIIIPLVLTPYLSRVLGAYEIGRYAFEYSVASYFALFVILGTKNYGSKVIASYRDDEEQMIDIFWNIYAMQFFIMMIASVLYVAYILRLAHAPQIAMPFYLIILASGIDITWFFWGMEEFKYTVRRDFAVKICTTMLILLCVKTQADTWKYALIISTGMLISQLILWFRFFSKYKMVKPELNKVFKHVKPNLVMFIPVAAVNIYKTMDKVMLELMSNSNEVGYYYSCEKITNVPLALVTSLNAVMLPRMSYLHSKRKKTIDIIMKSVLFSVCITTMISVGILASSSQFVPLFYGPGYEKCVVNFYILLPSCSVIAFTNVICSQYLIPNNRTNIYAGARVAGAVVNLVANALFIPMLMSYGAALGTLITELVVCFIQAIYVYKQLPIIKMFIEYLFFTISGAVSLGIISLFSFYENNAWVGVLERALVAIGIYCAIVIICGSLYRCKVCKKNRIE